MVHFLSCYFHFAFHGLDRSFMNDFKAFPSFDDFLLTFYSSKYFFSIPPDLMKVESNRIARDSYRSGTTQTVAFAISQAFNRVFNASLLRKLKSHGILDQVFGLILSILSNRQLWLVLDRNFWKRIKITLEFLKNLFLILNFPLVLQTFLIMLAITYLYILINTTLYFKSDQVFDLRQQLELVSELESNVEDIVYWGRRDAKKMPKKLICLKDQPSNSGVIDVKMDGSITEGK